MSISPNPAVMGVLNITPDSFYESSQFRSVDAALRRVEILLAEGVDIIDVGGESTRPGAQAVSVDEECSRVLPIIQAIRTISDIPLSVDTSQAVVMREAHRLGVTMINDQRALTQDGALATAAELSLPIVLMHMQNQPHNMQDNPQYNDVVSDVMNFFIERILVCEQAGISREQLILDPGFCFGKTVDHNLSLMKHIGRFQEFQLPILIGVSRKSLIGNVLNVPIDERLPGGLALAAYAVMQGVRFIRTHDVKATREVIQILSAVMRSE